MPFHNKSQLFIICSLQKCFYLNWQMTFLSYLFTASPFLQYYSCSVSPQWNTGLKLGVTIWFYSDHSPKKVIKYWFDLWWMPLSAFLTAACISMKSILYYNGEKKTKQTVKLCTQMLCQDKPFSLSCSDHYLILPLGGHLTQAKYLQFNQCTPFHPEGP